jgi:hypothetical protein
MANPDPFASGSAFQSFAKPRLERYFEDVRREWSSSLGATDSLRRDVQRYAPRVDLAVGPFNVAPGRADITVEMLPPTLRHWFDGMRPNDNPRCLLAIEVVYSGSAKHMLGDLLNASALGLFGLVVCHESKLAKVKRNREYAIELASLGKIPTLFQNVRVVSFSAFAHAVG